MATIPGQQFADWTKVPSVNIMEKLFPEFNLAKFVGAAIATQFEDKKPPGPSIDSAVVPPLGQGLQPSPQVGINPNSAGQKLQMPSSVQAPQLQSLPQQVQQYMSNESPLLNKWGSYVLPRS
jgi:hypothetical protein